MTQQEIKTALKNAVAYLYGKKIIASDTEIGEKTGYKKSAISLYINGATTVSKKFINEFEKVFELNLKDFTENAGRDNEAKVVSMQSDHDKYIRLLEKNSQHLEEHNRILREKVALDLKTVLDNQLTLTVLFESYLKSLSALLIQDSEQQQEFRLELHKDAFEQLRELRKTGNHIEIDKTSIVSK